MSNYFVYVQKKFLWQTWLENKEDMWKENMMKDCHSFKGWGVLSRNKTCWLISRASKKWEKNKATLHHLNDSTARLFSVLGEE